MPWPWQRREHEADRLEDLASLLDAGVGIDAALASSTAEAGAGLTDALGSAGFALDDIDRAVIGAAELSGEVGRGLRDRAAARRTQAGVLALLALRLAYPLLVLAMACVVTAWLAFLGLGGLWWLPIVILAIGSLAIALTILLFRRARHDPGFDGQMIAPLGNLLRSWGTAPYLEAMRSLYGAGVPIDEAHDLATRTVPFAHQRARLAAAAGPLGERRGYVESLAATGAVGDEVRGLLDAGERAGQLEDALERSATRQREAFQRSLKRGIVVVGAVAYGLAVVVVVLVVADFYGGLFARLRGR